MPHKYVYTFLFMIIIYFIIETISVTTYSLISRPQCNNVQKYEYGGLHPGNTLLIIGSVHGNEPAGHYALKILKKNLDNKKINIANGKLILIPNPNFCGIKYNYREMPGFKDINRGFPKSINDKSLTINNQKIVEYIKKTNPDIILDFHEAWSYYKINKKSMGSTIIIQKNDNQHIVSKCIKRLNKSIKNEKKKWSIITEMGDNLGSLRHYCKLNKKKYVLIETSGQLNVQKLDIRINQNLLIINTFLKMLQIIN